MAIKIPRRAHRCIRGQEIFKEGDVYYSRLILDRKEEWKREDFCQGCWNNSNSHKEPYWRSKIPVRSSEKEGKKLVKEEMEERAHLLLQEESTSPEERYLLALLLKRARRFQHMGEEVREGKPLFVFMDRQDGELYFIEKREVSPTGPEALQFIEKIGHA